MYDFFQQIGLPIWIVDDFSQLLEFRTEEQLIEKYNSILAVSKTGPAYFEYWETLITSHLI
jgi:hypothetical protein